MSTTLFIASALCLYPLDCIAITAQLNGPDFLLSLKGEELRKLIGAPAYIECSSKTQQVGISYSCY